MKETEKIEIMHFDQEGYLEDGKALYETGKKMTALADKRDSGGRNRRSGRGREPDSRGRVCQSPPVRAAVSCTILGAKAAGRRAEYPALSVLRCH